MEPIPTPVIQPIHLQIADEIRMAIESGALGPGAQLPTIRDLAERWRCSMGSVRAALDLLKAQGLISTGRGRPPVVRHSPVRAVRASSRHQAEKDAALYSEAERAAAGESEINLGLAIDQVNFAAEYSQVEAGELARVLQINESDSVLRRHYSHNTPDGLKLSDSISYIPLAIIDTNPKLLDADNEPWPGGTMHQLLTVGVEVVEIRDLVTARAPTTVEKHAWKMQEGIPLICCRRISSDGYGRVVEISDSAYPSDRTEFEFVTILSPWPKEKATLGQ